MRGGIATSIVGDYRRPRSRDHRCRRWQMSRRSSNSSIAVVELHEKALLQSKEIRLRRVYASKLIISGTAGCHRRCRGLGHLNPALMSFSGGRAEAATCHVCRRRGGRLEMAAHRAVADRGFGARKWAACMAFRRVTSWHVSIGRELSEGVSDSAPAASAPAEAEMKIVGEYAPLS